MPKRPRGSAAPVPPSVAKQTLIGSTLLRRVDDPEQAPLRIGSQVWTLRDLARRVGVVNTNAARRLSRAAKEIGAKNLRDLYAHTSPYTFAGIKSLGTTTMYVLWSLFEAEGFDPDAWAAAGERDAALVSFVSLKRREQAADKRTRDDARKRTGRRRATLRELDAAADDRRA